MKANETLINEIRRTASQDKQLEFRKIILFDLSLGHFRRFKILLQVTKLKTSLLKYPYHITIIPMRFSWKSSLHKFWSTQSWNVEDVLREL